MLKSKYRYSRDYLSKKMHTFAIILIYFTILPFISYYSTHDRVSCVVSNAGISQVNGYYSAINYFYQHIGENITFIPDFFDLVENKRITEVDGVGTAIIHEPEMWKFIATNIVTPYKSISNISSSPPTNHWLDSNNQLTNLQITNIYGSFNNIPKSINYSQDSNIMDLIHHPINTLLIILMLYIYYLFITNKLDRNIATMSYESIIQKNEYWRIFSSSLSHFDITHIGFNLMSLYQFKDLEILFGSIKYYYYTINLIIITIIICLFIQYILIKKFHQLNQIQQTSIGFSCVLFAWMVVIR